MKNSYTYSNIDDSNWIDPKFQPGLVSIIIPTYNRANLIRETLDSVFNQTYRPIECIIVDDGSTDNTNQIVNDLQKNYNTDDFTLQYHFQVNSGAPSARNLGTKISVGEYIQYLDSDDLLYPDKIRIQVEYLKSHPTCDGVFGDWEHGSIEVNELINGQKDNDLLAQFYGGRVIPTLSFLFARRIVEKIGEWDINLKRNQEVDFHLRGVLVGGDFDYFPTITGLWREHEGERIVTTNGVYYSLLYHKKWIIKLKELNKLTPKIKKIASVHLLYMANSLDYKYFLVKVKYISWAFRLNPDLKEFKTKRFQLMKKTFGIVISVCIWILYAKFGQRKQLNSIM